MILRNLTPEVLKALDRHPAVAIIGPRQVGKTTLAFEIKDQKGGVYFDLESRADREKLQDPEYILRKYKNRLVILDEIHRMPEIFDSLRGIIDEGRREGLKTNRFLILGSASIDLLNQSSESLAGRIEYVDLSPLSIIETGPDSMDTLWVRGGFPESYLAKNDEDSFKIRSNFIRTYLERDIPLFGPRIPAETLERFWIMLSHCQGQPLNASRIAGSLGVSAPTVTSYTSLLTDLLLLRKLQPYYKNTKKRLVKSPKTYIRDSGLLHALLNISSFEDLLAHPVVGGSWEGFVIENLLSVTPYGSKASFYRTSGGAEIDLIIEMGGGNGTWAIEIKRGLTPTVEKGFYYSLDDLQPDKAFVVYQGTERYPKKEGVEVISLGELCQELISKG